MEKRRCVLAVGILVFNVGWLRANEAALDVSQKSFSSSVETAAAVTHEPWVHHAMRPALRTKIESAFPLAVARVRDNPDCSALFTMLGSDGVEMLDSTLYFAMPLNFDGAAICERGYAATLVGARSTFVCRHILQLSVERAAQVLIHEALHHAGLTEFPQDPEGMTSARINRMVKNSCRP